MTDFTPSLHPRDRKGRFRDALGLTKSDRLVGEFEVGATPYREGGAAKAEDYYGTTRYKGFEAALPDMAERRGLSLTHFDRVGGVWAGGGEPSAQVHLQGDKNNVVDFMDAVGSRYNQDAVIAFTSRDGGPSTRYFSSPSDIAVTNAQVAQAIAEVNDGRPEAEQIQGATVHSDGRVEVLDTEDQALETIRALARRLGIHFGYDEGEAFLRFKYEDYPDAQGRWQPKVEEAFQGGGAPQAGGGPALPQDVGGGKDPRGDAGDVYQAYGIEVAEGEAPPVGRSL